VAVLQAGRALEFRLVKMLYYADRMALECWHRTITGDAFYSLPEGPIVSTAYDLMKGSGPKKLQERWFTFIQPRQGNTILRLLTPLTDEQIAAIEEEVAQATFMEERFCAPAGV
jgi:uncharacterized phage-associated protein